MIEQLLNLTNYATETRVARRKGKGGSQEFFTPYSMDTLTMSVKKEGNYQ